MSAAEPNRWLKLKTKQLIKLCGGLEEASRACEEACRAYSTSQLGRCQNPREADFLPIDIVLCLEAYCGQPVVTRAMAEARPSAVAAGCIRDEVSDWAERAGEMSKAVRLALEGDDEIDAREGVGIRMIIERGREDLNHIEAALDAKMALRRSVA